ncbi:DUF2807 domain-containing protein [Porphyrobacter algicida]|uniref:DUF2807 domain-containing protein n=1 Tax=Qipengyuania algicida TaxID=1836209 RepID=A0A845ACN0_9SPHN|nr:head GIN domain-containing protein [Qipengyuania algicida]MXP28010.1 DUF2807 domain-containing protein [Qipengyuania algicida]
MSNTPIRRVAVLHWKPAKFLPIAALAAVLALAGCDNAHISINDDDGVPLSELKTDGPAPTKLVLASPDKVSVSDGGKLDISVSGDKDAVDALRFSLKDGTLGIYRKGKWTGNGTALVKVTMPSPREIVLAGSGDVEAQSLTGDAEVTIAGSGTAKVAHIDANSLDVNLLGSGSMAGSGKANSLDLKVAGSGEGRMHDLNVNSADVKILGSGSAAFSSNGTVEAKIAGSGSVDVYGRASCKINSVGSGTLNCHNSDSATASYAPDAPDAPAAPNAPDAPPPPAPGA